MNKPLTLTQKKRLAIVEAAIVEFREKGFQNANMDSLAKIADVSKKTVYNHFDSKQALFDELLKQMLEATGKAISVSFDPQIPLKDQLLEIAHQELQMLRNERFINLSRIIFSESIHNPAIAAAAEASTGQEGQLEKWLRQGCEEGQLKTLEVCIATRQFYGLIKSFALWPQLIRGAPMLDDEASEKVAESAVEMFLAYYAS